MLASVLQRGGALAQRGHRLRTCIPGPELAGTANLSDTGPGRRPGDPGGGAPGDVNVRHRARAAGSEPTDLGLRAAPRLVSGSRRHGNRRPWSRCSARTVTRLCGDSEEFDSVTLKLPG